MSWWRTLLSWRDAPVSAAHSPGQDPAPRPRTSSLQFSVNVPPEMLGGVGDGPPVPRVSREQALSVPAVKRVRDLIAGTLGTLPLSELDSANNAVFNELLDQPENDVARSVTMARTVEDMVFEGRAWWRILEFAPNGYPARIRRLESRSVTVRQMGRVYVSRTGNAEGLAWEWVPDEQLIRIDSPNDPLLIVGARAIRDCMALARAVTRNVDNPVPLGYFSPAGEVDPGDDDEVEEILDDWEDSIARRAWPYLGAGLKANALAWNPEQLQLGQARDAAILEIARLGGVDPEELGVSTTSRTYANAEQRRLDLIDFTLHAYVSAIEDRLSMADVTVPGHRVWFEFDGFLRSDTQSRMQTYSTGMQVGAYDAERIAQIERLPISRVRRALAAAKPAPAAPPPPTAPDRPSQEDTVPQATAPAPSLAFTADATLQIGFVLSDVDAEFRVNPEKRTVSGMTVPWNTVAYSGGYKWMFQPDSLHYSDPGRVKLDKDHQAGSEIGRAVRLQNTNRGLDATFKVGRGALGDTMLNLAEDGVYDGFSVQVDFASQADGWTAHPEDDSVRLVHSATLRKVALTAMPAFDDARVASVVATRGTETPAMTAPVTTPPAPAGAPPAATPPAAVPPAPAPDLATFTAGLTDALTAAVTAAFAKLPTPQGRPVIPAGGAVVSSEAPVYAMNGNGPSFVRDAWKARTEGDHEARERIAKFQKQTADVAEQVEFAINTGNSGAVVPPGYRPDMYVTQLFRGRPLVDSASRGTLTDATPFTLPSFTSSSGATADHVEGTNPTAGSLTIDTVTVTPAGVSGLFQLTREIVDSANPQIDAIAMQAMQEDYSQRTEAKVYAELNGANGQGGTITAGFVPSGAQVATTTGTAGGIAAGGDELLAGIRGALALYPFRRFASPNRAHLSQEATQSLAQATDSTGRPLLPSIGAQNTAGLGNAITQGWYIDGLPFVPTWSLTGNAAGDADVFMFNANDLWAWESGILMFQFVERNGPALIELALFGYFATRLIRPVGVSAIRHTVTP